MSRRSAPVAEAGEPGAAAAPKGRKVPPDTYLTLAAAAGLSVALLLPESMAPLRAACAFFLLGWFPGYVLLRLAARLHATPSVPSATGGFRDDDPLWMIAAPLALSPIVSTAVVITAALAGVPFGSAAPLPALLAIPLSLLPRGPRDPVAEAAPAPGAGTDATNVRRPILILAAVAALLVGVVYLANPWLAWRADGRFHIGVVGEILRGGLPPTDPFFAGLDLQYMWFFHAYVAALRSLSDLPAAALLSAVNVVALFAFTILAWCVVRAIGRSPREAFLAALLTAFAMGGHGWLFVPIRLFGAFTGSDRGWKAVGLVLDVWPPRITHSLGFFAIWMDQAFLLRKFLVGTAMSLSLIAMLLHLELSRRALFGGGAWNAVVLSLVSAGVVALHPMMGLPAVAVVCGAAVVLYVLLRFVVKAPAFNISFGRIVVLGGANIAGVLLSVPYLLLVTAGKEGAGGLPIDVFPPKVISLVLGTFGVGILGVPWIVRTLRNRAGNRLNDLWFAVWAALLVLFAFFVRFPLERENIDKPTILTHVPLALAAGIVVAGWLGHGGAGRRRLALACVLLMTVPLNAICLMGYAGEEDPRTYRAHELESYRFVDATAPDEAIVFDSQDRDRPAVELGRRQYWSHEQFASTHEYPRVEMDRRRALRDAIYAPGGPMGSDVAELRGIGSPVYVIVRAGAAVPGPGWPAGRGPVDGSFGKGDPDPLEAHAAFERVFDTDDVRVYRLK